MVIRITTYIYIYTGFYFKTTFDSCIYIRFYSTLPCLTIDAVLIFARHINITFLDFSDCAVFLQICALHLTAFLRFGTHHCLTMVSFIEACGRCLVRT
jgi:hypothetical protein